MPHIQLKPYVHTFPAPAVLIGCGTVDAPNLMTCAWFGVVCSEPPQVAVAIRPSRFSHQLIDESGEFTVNVPFVHQLKAVQHCGAVSGRKENKVDTLGLTATACAPLAQAPMIVEMPIILACKVRERMELGSHTLFIGEVLAIHAEERIVRRSGKVDPLSRQQIVYLDGRYWSLSSVEKSSVE
ncbi:MAG: flavin reductase family protein [bacterium]